MQIKNNKTNGKERIDVFTYHFDNCSGTWWSPDTPSSIRQLISTFGFTISGQVDYLFATNYYYEIKMRKIGAQINVYVKFKKHHV